MHAYNGMYQMQFRRERIRLDDFYGDDLVEVIFLYFAETVEDVNGLDVGAGMA